MVLLIELKIFRLKNDRIENRNSDIKSSLIKRNKTKLVIIYLRYRVTCLFGHGINLIYVLTGSRVKIIIFICKMCSLTTG